MKPCVCFFLMLLGLAPFSHGAGAPAFPPDCWGVYTWGGGRIDRAAYPHIKGFPITLNWANVEPRNGQFAFEESLGKSLRTAHENDFYVHLMLWVVPNSPQWLYENGVPKVDAPARINPFRREVKPDYPYYFDEDYKRFFHRLIRAFGDYVRNLPPELQSRVLFVQSAEGSTGDGQPYKSQPTNPKYRISPEQWSQFRMETWEVYRQAFQKGFDRPIPLLVNNDANGKEEHEWLLKNLDVIGCKQGMFSHGYHISEEQDRIAEWRAFLAKAQSLGKTVFTRGEQDGEWNICGWSKQNPEQAFYWSGIYALHCGLDLWNIPADACAGDRIAPAISFFTKYAGQNDPSSSPAAFCALRKGLDAADTVAYPEAEFGKASKSNIDRYLRIVERFADRGAIQGDPEKATGGGMKNRQSDDYNDAGWRILPDNYCRFLEQIDPENTSVGYWHVEPRRHIYSRFARGFDRAAGKTIMSFRLDPRFFSNPSGPHNAEVRVVYLDKGRGAWALKYAGADTGEPAELKMQCEDSGEWKEAIFQIDAARFDSSLPGGADMQLALLEGDDVIFHLLELNRR